jgi:hypothetical protein
MVLFKGGKKKAEPEKKPISRARGKVESSRVKAEAELQAARVAKEEAEVGRAKAEVSLAALQVEKEKQDVQIATLKGDVAERQSHIEVLSAKLKAKAGPLDKAAFVKYAAHSPMCKTRYVPDNQHPMDIPVYPCTCGLTGILARLEV